jgi:hypothetical protein
LSWLDVLAIYVALSFERALRSTAALLVRGALPHAPDRAELCKLLAAGPLELVAHTDPRVILGTFVG